MLWLFSARVIIYPVTGGYAWDRCRRSGRNILHVMARCEWGMCWQEGICSLVVIYTCNVIDNAYGATPIHQCNSSST